MLVLAIDTALAACSAGLYEPATGRTLAERIEPMPHGHAERLAPMVDEIMREAALPFAAIDRIAVSTGPGTFTGVRIGIAFARGLALAIDRPAIGISTLKALAASLAGTDYTRPVAALIDARRDAIYAQVFSPQLEPLTEPEAILLPDIATRDALHGAIAIGSGARLVADTRDDITVHAGSSLPHPAILARLATELSNDTAVPRPLYLRPPDAKQQARTLKLSPADISLSPVDASHSEVLAAIHAECLPKPWRADEFAAMLAMPGTTCILACSAGNDGEPLGFILVRQAADEAEILMLATRPAARRRKVASRLLEDAARILKDQQATVLHLEVDETNEAARAFYANTAFTETGRRSNYYAHTDGTRHDAILMQRHL